ASVVDDVQLQLESLTASLDGKAEAEALDALREIVDGKADASALESEIQDRAWADEDLQNQIGYLDENKASQFDLNVEIERALTAESELGSSIEDLNAAVNDHELRITDLEDFRRNGGFATQEAFEEEVARLDAKSDDETNRAIEVESDLQSQLGDKADQSSLDDLSTGVAEIQAQLEGLNDQINEIVEPIGAWLEELQGQFEELVGVVETKADQSALEELDAVVAGKADQDDLDEVVASVDEVRFALYLKADIEELQTEAADRAAGDEFLQGQVDDLGDALGELAAVVDALGTDKADAQDLADLKDVVDGKADQSGLDDIQAQVTELADAVSEKADASVVDDVQLQLESLTASLDGKAEAEALDALRE
ncbi:MAG: hypothetical protein EBZ51_13435, partial [Synechococcaceae bacterium WB9_2_112]|nr:hypothetical protein [Synechococcaceae bacterium WB9_2_112]